MSKRFGELYAAFMEDDHKKILKLTDDLPSAARSTIQAVSELLNERRDLGMTPLVAALLHGNLPLCERLINEGIHSEDFRKGTCSNKDKTKMMKLHQEAGTQLILGPKAKVFKDYNMTSAMFWVIKSGSLFLVEKLVEAGHNIDLPTEKVQGMPALSIAIMDNKMDLVKKLLALSANVHAKDFNSGTPIDVAIDTCHLDMIKVVIEHGENPNCKHHQVSPIIRAILNTSNNIATIELLVKLGANINLGFMNGQFVPPLLCAVSSCRYDVATYLIHKGADVRAQDGKSETALHALTITLNPNLKDTIALAQLLIEKGANVNEKNLMGETPIVGACRAKIPEFVELLLSAGAAANIRTIHPTSPLNVALTPSFVINIDPNNKTQVYCKPESGSFLQKQCEITKLLLKYGADVDSQEATKVTPLHAAVTGSNFEAVKILLKAGANINSQDDVGVPPLFCAIEKQELRLVQYLVENGACVNIKDFQGTTPLKVALDSNCSELVKYLVKAGAADVNERNNQGVTPLHFAALSSSCKLAKLLIEAGASLKAEDIYGNTPFDYGILHPGVKSEFIKLFLDYGFDPNLADKYGLTPYQYIASKQNPELLKILWYYGCPCDEVDLSRVNAVCSTKQYFHIFNVLHSAAMKLGKQKTKNELTQKELLKTQNTFLIGVKNNNKKLVLDCLQNGAVARGCSKELKYPLHSLVERRFYDTLEVLLKEGVPANVLDRSGSTPLQLAVRGGDLQSCRLLLQHGALYRQMREEHSKQAQIDEVWKLFQTIHKTFISVQKGDNKALKLLKKCVDDQDLELYHILMNCVNDKGHTVMAEALDCGQTDILCKLMALKLSAPDLC